FDRTQESGNNVWRASWARYVRALNVEDGRGPHTLPPLDAVVMKAWLKRIQARRSRREQRWLERWARIRAEGKTRFVLEGALTYGLTIVGAGDAYDWIFHGTHSLSLS